MHFKRRTDHGLSDIVHLHLQFMSLPPRLPLRSPRLRGQFNLITVKGAPSPTGQKIDASSEGGSHMI